jgi:hypothetical protein
MNGDGDARPPNPPTRRLISLRELFSARPIPSANSLLTNEGTTE